MEPDTAQHAGHLAPGTSAAKQQLVTFLTENTAPLLGTIRSYVQRMGLAQGATVPTVALEVLQEVAVEALDHADRFKPTSQPMAWLLGIALNVIKRKKVEFAKRAQRELSITNLSTMQDEPLNDSDLFDQLTARSNAGPEQAIEADEQAALMLALVSMEDQHILRLAFLYDFDREVLARQLGLTPVTARVRLHRALGRLRAAWQKQQLCQQEGESNG